MKILLDYIIMYSPAFFAVCLEFAIFIKVCTKLAAYFKKVDNTLSEIKESAEYKELKCQLRVVIDENAKLKKQMNVLLAKLNHERVPDETVQNN